MKIYQLHCSTNLFDILKLFSIEFKTYLKFVKSFHKEESEGRQAQQEGEEKMTKIEREDFFYTNLDLDPE